MVRCFPDQPRLVNPAEQTVWDRLRAQCGPGDLLIAGQRVTNHTKDFEIDLVAVLEGAGVVTVEVKGGQVTHDGQSWRQRHGRIDPVSQVRRQVRPAQLRRDRSALGRAAPAPVGPPGGTASHRAARRLRAARVSTVDDHRPHPTRRHCRVGPDGAAPAGFRQPGPDRRGHRPTGTGARRTRVAAARRRGPRPGTR